MSPHIAYPKARAAALRALEIDSDLATAMSILGYIRAVYDWDWVGAERDMRRALKLDPNDSGTVWSLAHVLAMLGRHEEAIQMTVDYAEDNPAVGRNHQEVANRLLDAGRYRAALAALEKAGRLGAEQAQIDETVGVVLVGLRDIDGALREFERAVSAGQRPSRAVARLAFVYGATGREPEAQLLLDELKQRSATESVSALTFATAYLGLGDRERALDYLEAAARDRDRDIIATRFDPMFATLHDEPRYAALTEQFGIPGTVSFRSEK
jgi:serine/threonine-protein kinase